MRKSTLICFVLFLCMFAIAIPAFAESEDGWTAFSASSDTLTWMNGVPIELDPGIHETVDFRNYSHDEAETPELGDPSIPMWLLFAGFMIGTNGTIAVHKLRLHKRTY